MMMLLVTVYLNLWYLNPNMIWPTSLSSWDCRNWLLPKPVVEDISQRFACSNFQTAKPGNRDRSRSPIDGDESPIATTNLIKMQHIIFLDLDNWPGFFSKLPRILPDRTFVWGFYGGRNVWREPTRCHVFNQMKQRRLFYLHEQCGRTKDAADFAIVLTVSLL